jgi:hypothetical protein
MKKDWNTVDELAASDFYEFAMAVPFRARRFWGTLARSSWATEIPR